MICGRPALIVIQMQRGEKAVMFRQMAKHARLMTTSRYIERTAPHRKSWVNALKPMRATTPGLSSMGGGSLLKPAGKQVLYQIRNLHRVIICRERSTGQCNTACSLSAGVRKPKVFRGR